MCGIAGFWDMNGRFGSARARALLNKMTCTLRHRGPDDEGLFLGENGIALGHRRLAIVDLSAEGHQPMESASGRYVMVFNGEVYNHGVLRPELIKAGYTFRGHSDTEVMLAAMEHWGFSGALSRFNGMFAFAVWDRVERTLVLARDRLGIKPLYCGWVGGVFAFASELKALRALPGFDNPVDRDALCLYLRHNVVPAPYSIYRGIGKLRPGTCLRVDGVLAKTPLCAGALAERAVAYWSARAMAEAGAGTREHGCDADAVARLDALLRDAVGSRMMADVPLGAFLSGGIDSSVVVALMQAQSPRPIQTFAIGFDAPEYDEAPHARAVAQHLGTDHHELRLTSQDALDVIPALPAIWDEPFADSSQIPTHLVSRFARARVTVSLSGDGGDELFAGYNRYFWGANLRQRMNRIPHPLRRSSAALLRRHRAAFGRLLAWSTPLLPANLRLRDPKNKIAVLADMLGARTDDDRYRCLVSHWRDPAAVVIGGAEPPTALTDSKRQTALQDPVERMMYADLVSYLPDDVLTKVDRASMAVGLEARTPLLDHRVAEFAWQTPMTEKVRGGQGKWLLRQVLYRYVPKELIERPKTGFGVPLGSWLRGPLRDWAEALLDAKRLHAEGYFDPVPIRDAWQAHVRGRSNDPYRLWDVLMFQAWLDRNSSAT